MCYEHASKLPLDNSWGSGAALIQCAQPLGAAWTPAPGIYDSASSIIDNQPSLASLAKCWSATSSFYHPRRMP